MTILDFNKYFLTTKFHITISSSKKPNKLFRKYLICIRYKNYMCLNYMAVFSLLQQLFFFIQYSTTSATPFVFFIENSWYFPMYVELAQSCNEFVCYSPIVYDSINSWNPNVISGDSFFSFPKVLYAGIAISILPQNYAFLLNLISKGWPCILFSSLHSKPDKQKKTYSANGSSYIILTSETMSLKETYFNVALLTKVIRTEKQRMLSFYNG